MDDRQRVKAWLRLEGVDCYHRYKYRESLQIQAKERQWFSLLAHVDILYIAVLRVVHYHPSQPHLQTTLQYDCHFNLNGDNHQQIALNSSLYMRSTARNRSQTQIGKSLWKCDADC